MILKPSQIPKFTGWLQAQGAEILPTTNEYELIRFRCKTGTGVVYCKSHGFATSVSSQMVSEAIDCYKRCKSWSGKGKPTKSTGGSKLKRQLLDRDGDECFYCGFPILGTEYNIEHLISVTGGGSDRLENKVLTHITCNDMAGHKHLPEKLKLRDQMRGYIY